MNNSAQGRLTFELAPTKGPKQIDLYGKGGAMARSAHPIRPAKA